MQNLFPPRPVRDSGFVSIVSLVLSSCLFASGCTTLQTAPLPGAPAPPKSIVVKVGDEVEVKTKALKTYTFKVSAIESDALVGPKVRIKYDEISVLKVRRLSRGYTAVTAGAILTTVLIGLVIYALAHAGPGLAGG